MRIALGMFLGALGCQGGGGSSEHRTADAETAAPETSAPAPGTAVAAEGTAAPGGTAAPAVTHENYVIEVVPPSASATNQEAQTDVRLVPRNGYHVNAEYPIRLRVTAPAGVTLARDSFDKAAAAEFGDPLAVFAVRFTPTSTGQKDFSAEFAFSVCNPQTCLLERQNLRWSVQAQ